MASFTPLPLHPQRKTLYLLDLICTRQILLKGERRVVQHTPMRRAVRTNLMPEDRKEGNTYKTPS